MTAELFRYLLAGVVNTAAGYGLFLILLKIIGVADYAANTISYIAGLTIAFLLNRYYVFQDATITYKSALRFAAGFLFSYTLNMITFVMLINAGLRAEYAQIFSMAVYTISFYATNRIYVWRANV